MHTNKTYKLSSIKDLFDQIPANRIETCMSELTSMILDAKQLEENLREVAKYDERIDLSKPIMIFPDTIEWVDDGKENLDLKLTLV